MRKILLLLCVALMSFVFTNAQTATAPSVGDGTVGNPYQIATLENLYWISSQISGTQKFTGKYFKQTADIDASSTSGWSTTGWLPIGTSTNTFQGNYDGQNYSISGLYINRTTTDNIGLFGYISTVATIQNIRLINVNITGQSNVGALIGNKANESTTTTIQNCSSSGTVTGKFEIAGLIGNIGGATTISKCFSTAAVNSNNTSQYHAGLIGGISAPASTTVAVSNCYATGVVTGAQYASGFCSGFWGTGTVTLTNCYSA